EISVEIGLRVSSAQLDDGNGLPASVHAGGEAVGLGDLHGGVGGRGRGAGVGRHAKVRLGLRAVVESMHATNDVAQLGGNVDRTAASTVGCALVLVRRKVHLKRFCKRTAASRQGHTARGK